MIFLLVKIKELLKVSLEKLKDFLWQCTLWLFNVCIIYIYIRMSSFCGFSPVTNRTMKGLYRVESVDESCPKDIRLMFSAVTFLMPPSILFNLLFMYSELRGYLDQLNIEHTDSNTIH